MSGRPVSIPPAMWEAAFAIYAQGKGYRATVDALDVLGVMTSKSSVERLIRGLPPLSERRRQWEFR